MLFAFNTRYTYFQQMKIMYLLPVLFVMACGNAQPAHVDKGADTVAMTADSEAAYNMNVLQKLVAAGDSMAKPRLVRHWIYFKDTVDRGSTRFLQWLINTM